MIKSKTNVPSPITLIPNVNNNNINTNSTIVPSVTDRLSPSQQVTQTLHQTQISDKEWTSSNKQWTKFPESPTSSNVSSPGPKPVNFDMQRTAQAVVSDPQILHPVPLRVTPVGNLSTTSMTTSLTGPESIDDETSNNRHYTRNKNLNNNDSLVYNDLGTRELGDTSPKSNNLMQQRDSLQNEIRPIQRPQPKKITQKSIGAIPPPPQRESNTITSNDSNNDIVHNSINIITTKKDPPPPPPPR